jgi:hypothetical protein
MEPAAGELIDVGRVRVQRSLADIAVAIQAHDLPVRRYMPARLIHQPICASVTSQIVVATLGLTLKLHKYRYTLQLGRRKTYYYSGN